MIAFHTCLSMFCSRSNFCLSLSGLDTEISSGSAPVLSLTATKQMTSDNSCVTNLKQYNIILISAALTGAEYVHIPMWWIYTNILKKYKSKQIEKLWSLFFRTDLDKHFKDTDKKFVS